MRLILVAGSAHGKVLQHGGDKPPEQLREHFATDPELGELKIAYRLVHWLPGEAYYIPLQRNAGSVIKELMTGKL